MAGTRATAGSATTRRARHAVRASPPRSPPRARAADRVRRTLPGTGDRDDAPALAAPAPQEPPRPRRPGRQRLGTGRRGRAGPGHAGDPVRRRSTTHRRTVRRSVPPRRSRPPPPPAARRRRPQERRSSTGSRRAWSTPTPSTSAPSRASPPVRRFRPRRRNAATAAGSARPGPDPPPGPQALRPGPRRDRASAPDPCARRARAAYRQEGPWSGLPDREAAAAVSLALAVAPERSAAMYDTGEHVMAAGDLYPDQLAPAPAPGCASPTARSSRWATSTPRWTRCSPRPDRAKRLKALIQRSTDSTGAPPRPRKDVSNSEWDTADRRPLPQAGREQLRPLRPGRAHRDDRRRPRYDNRSRWEELHQRAINEKQQLILANPNASPPGGPLDHQRVRRPLPHRRLRLRAPGQQGGRAREVPGPVLLRRRASTRRGRTFFEQVAEAGVHGEVAGVSASWSPAAPALRGRLVPPPATPTSGTAGMFAEVLKQAAEAEPVKIANLAVKVIHDKLNRRRRRGRQRRGRPGVDAHRRRRRSTRRRSPIMRRAVQQSVDNLNDPAILAQQPRPAPVPGPRVAPHAAADLGRRRQVDPRWWRRSPTPRSAELVTATADLITKQLDSLIKALLDSGKDAGGLTMATGNRLLDAPPPRAGVHRRTARPAAWVVPQAADQPGAGRAARERRHRPRPAGFRRRRRGRAARRVAGRQRQMRGAMAAQLREWLKQSTDDLLEGAELALNRYSSAQPAHVRRGHVLRNSTATYAGAARPAVRGDPRRTRGRRADPDARLRRLHRGRQRDRRGQDPRPGTEFGGPLNIRSVYMMSCVGASLNQAWLDAGARTSAGTTGNNDLPEPTTHFFWTAWKEGQTFETAVTSAYRRTVERAQRRPAGHHLGGGSRCPRSRGQAGRRLHAGDDRLQPPGGRRRRHPHDRHRRPAGPGDDASGNALVTTVLPIQPPGPAGRRRTP